MKVVALSCGVTVLAVLAYAQVDISNQQNMMQGMVSLQNQIEPEARMGNSAMMGNGMLMPGGVVPGVMPGGVIPGGVMPGGVIPGGVMPMEPIPLTPQSDDVLNSNVDDAIQDAMKLHRTISHSQGDLLSPKTGDDDNTFQKLDTSNEIQSLTDMNAYQLQNQDHNLNANDVVGTMQVQLSKMYNTIAEQKHRLEEQKEALLSLTRLVDTNRKVYIGNQNTTEQFSENLNHMFDQYQREMVNATLLPGETAPPTQGGKKSFIEEASSTFSQKLETLKNRVQDE